MIQRSGSQHLSLHKQKRVVMHIWLFCRLHPKDKCCHSGQEDDDALQVDIQTVAAILGCLQLLLLFLVGKTIWRLDSVSSMTQL